MPIKQFTDPIVGALRALGVMFANPPPGTTDLAGIVFDDVSGLPTGIQAPDGTIKPFPGGVGSGIPIPASNSAGAVVLNSDPAKDINVAVPASTGGTGGGYVRLSAGDSPSGQAGGVNVSGGNGGVGGNGGSFSLQAGSGNSGGANGAQILGFGGITPNRGGALTVQAGSGSGGGGGKILLYGGSDNTAAGGDLEIGPGKGVTADGKLKIGVLGGTLAAAPGTGTVAATDNGPGVAALAVTKWVKVTVDGVDGYLPFYS